MPENTAPPPTLGFSMKEAAVLLNMSLPALKAAIFRGNVKVSRIGRRVVVPLAEITRLVERQS